ncbi:hypothetical protein E2542_SST23441 [Spatholobus suberectus]|nr:hypothetical protein E2542_SST23441 [Spatholobus suberectus]
MFVLFVCGVGVVMDLGRFAAWICKFSLIVWLMFVIKMVHVVRFKSVKVYGIIYVRKESFLVTLDHVSFNVVMGGIRIRHFHWFGVTLLDS